MADALGSNSKEQLKAIVDRIENLERDKAAVQEDIKTVYGEAKANGLDTKTIRQIVKARRISKAEREEQEAQRELYMHALGMLADTDLGQAALAAVQKTAAEADAATT